MRVVQVIPKFVLAGAEVMTVNLSIQLMLQGAEVSIISLYNFRSGLTDRLERSGVMIYFLDKKHGLDINIISQIAGVLRELKPDIIHTHLYALQYVMPASWLAKIPHKVHTVHSIASKELRFSRRVLHFICYHFCSVKPVAVSAQIQQSIVKHYRLNKKNVPTIPNGIDLQAPIRKESYHLGEKIKILHIGRFEPEKNHRVLISAFGKLKAIFPNTELYLVGDGSLFREIQSVVELRNLSDSVKFCGLVDDIYALMPTCDIFVLPSKWEGMPLTIIEAMACAMPIVASRTGGVPDLIESGISGLLCQPTAESLFQALQKMILSEHLRQTCAEQAFRNCARYSSEEMAKKYLLLYKEILNKNSNWNLR